MADFKKLTPISLSQNPHPVNEDGQEYKRAVRAQVENILAEYRAALPSNYVSGVTGPYYSIQFQAAAEQLAKVMLSFQEVYEDSDFDFIRPEFMWQILGSLVFPDGDIVGIPTIAGDVSYRTFLKAMVLLLLEGATPAAVKSGIELLTDAEITLIERVLTAGKPGSAWSLSDQFTFDVEVSSDGGSGFPDSPFVLKENVALVIRALKPAHVLYTYQHVFKESFGAIFSDSLSSTLSIGHYDDFRRFCGGAKQISSDAGEVLLNRFLFRDVSLDFGSVRQGSNLTFTEGSNASDVTYRVEEILRVFQDFDSVAHPYTTAPSGLSGSLTVSNSEFTDLNQDWALAVEGEILTLLSGVNAGTYRLDTVLCQKGGPVGDAEGPSSSVRPSYGIIRLHRRPPIVASGESYTITLDRLGVQEARSVLREDVSSSFFA